MVSDNVYCVVPVIVELVDGRYVIEIPDSVMENGGIDRGEVCRVAMLEPASKHGGGSEGDSLSQTGYTKGVGSRGEGPPVSVEDILELEITSVGDQGDGVARTEEGYVIFVPGTHKGDRVAVEIREVNPQYAFGDVIPRTKLDQTGE